MEAFLSTLPPYVHVFLDKHPATDVFNLLKELICFAVLYSEDRERIKNATDDLLTKRTNEINDQEDKKEKIIVGEPKEVVDAVVPEIPTETSKMPNTFPEWWGHQEFTPEKKPLEARVPSIWETQEPEYEQEKSQPRMPSLWECPEEPSEEKPVVGKPRQGTHSLWECQEETLVKKPVVRKPSLWEIQNEPKAHSLSDEHIKTQSETWISFDTERKSPRRPTSQVVIPNLRSYEETESPKPRRKTLAKEGSDTVDKSPRVTRSIKEEKTESPKPRRTSMIMPKQNAAVRARQEHAKQLQQDLLKATAVSVSSPTNQRLKQRASSGINWNLIKEEIGRAHV